MLATALTLVKVLMTTPNVKVTGSRSAKRGGNPKAVRSAAFGLSG